MKITIQRGIALALAIVIIINIGVINVFAENNENTAIEPSGEILLKDENQKAVQSAADSYDVIHNVSVIVSSQVIRIQEV